VIFFGSIGPPPNTPPVANPGTLAPRPEFKAARNGRWRWATSARTTNSPSESRALIESEVAVPGPRTSPPVANPIPTGGTGLPSANCPLRLFHAAMMPALNGPDST